MPSIPTAPYVVAAAWVAAIPPRPHPSEPHHGSRRAIVIACTLSPEALRTRRAGLPSDLLRRAECREDLPERLRLRFAPTSETLATIARAVEAEGHCCRFLRFTITVEPDGGPVLLELTGPPGSREFIDALLEE